MRLLTRHPHPILLTPHYSGSQRIQRLAYIHHFTQISWSWRFLPLTALFRAAHNIEPSTIAAFNLNPGLLPVFDASSPVFPHTARLRLDFVLWVV